MRREASDEGTRGKKMGEGWRRREDKREGISNKILLNIFSYFFK